ncbi:MAG: hypothetical protein KDI02_04055 [Anaerolineae bacterium]|nr:hypothetical protein [Anaerolineae bacterium]MCB0222839.1 hypothetical protein [Anaerolineae bacterium]MCB9104515.1 hypothetical protein [Anaerolineales bacterium]
MTSSKITHPTRYRVYQFFIALKAYLPVWAGGHRGELSAADRALVESILPTVEQRRLFAKMSPNDQRHALAVARTLQQAGHNHLPLLQAALLHDVAKSLGQPIIHRVVIVLLEAFRPQTLTHLANPSSTPNSSFIIQPSSFSRWRRPFVIHAHHPAIGAAWAKEAGCDPLAVDLILYHQAGLDNLTDIRHQRLLEQLQWADNLN